MFPFCRPRLGKLTVLGRLPLLKAWSRSGLFAGAFCVLRIAGDSLLGNDPLPQRSLSRAVVQVSAADQLPCGLRSFLAFPVPAGLRIYRTPVGQSGIHLRAKLGAGAKFESQKGPHGLDGPSHRCRGRTVARVLRSIRQLDLAGWTRRPLA